MITVSASLFQAHFRNDREPAINTQIKGGHGSGAEQAANDSLMQSLKENMGLDLKPEQTVKAVMFDVDVVMDTVLKHVNQRIEHAAANGATDEELEGLLAAARTGIETGFAQARDQIESLGKLNDDLVEKIDSAETGIYSGIDSLEEKLFATLPEEPETADTGGTNENSPAITGSAFEFEQSYQRQKNSFSFDLVTQEGDKVTIRAMSDLEIQEQAFSIENEGGSISAQSYSENYTSGFSFSVNGDLNEDEMTAIEDLLGQVNNLADEFYEGDLGTAFDMALELDSDEDQIAQFSLNLRQQQVSAYQYTGAADYTKHDALPRGIMQPLGQFAAGLTQAKQTADRFHEPRQLLEEMFKQMDDNPKLHDMLIPMLDKMAA